VVPPSSGSGIGERDQRRWEAAVADAHRILGNVHEVNEEDR